MNPISGILTPRPVELPAAPVASGPVGAGGPSFQNVMSQSLERVNALQQGSQSIALRFLQGEPIEVHQVALEQQQAALAFDLLLEVRNKVISAYQEVMRMPL
jgi:flagellar hook-basal body complex protein FliE